MEDKESMVSVPLDGVNPDDTEDKVNGEYQLEAGGGNFIKFER